MASVNTRLLHHLAVVFLLTQRTDSALVPRIKNHPELKPQASNTYIVHANHLAKPTQFANIEQWYHSMVAAYSSRIANTSGRILYTYDTVMHGFAVHLTADEARRIATASGVTGVYKEKVFQLQTTRSPGFMGLDPHHGAWNETNSGDGVIIGVIDSGIWPESASFNDRGLDPVRPSWRGKCVDAADFNASLCNNKLVGAKAFVSAAVHAWGLSGGGTVLSARDRVGHGTHVASTAAGAEVPDAGIYMFSRWTARGMAPKARIAVYRACGDYGCIGSDVAAAVEAAVKDGVDIISMSVGGPRGLLYEDAIATSTFGAERKGIFVAMGAGNDGPVESTVGNVAPWMTTVGASTVDRLFPANLTLGNGTVLTGQSSLQSTIIQDTGMIQLVSSECDKEFMNWTRDDKVKGKIMVCMDGSRNDAYGVLLQKAGGAGIVVVHRSEWSPDGTTSVFHFNLPGLTLSVDSAERLRAYMASVPNPVASFSFSRETTIIGENQAPVVAGFSSRGPNPAVPELLKPDLIAPGVNILAAWPRDAPLSQDPDGDDGRRADYNIVSGTSMATPHVAGVAALVKKKHPGWTPAMIRSALMTTAGTVDNMDHDILDNGATPGRHDVVRTATPFAAGAGHIRPNLALDPGLVYDAGARDYMDFLCALNYTTEQLQRFAPDMATCTKTLPGGPAGLNYPSFVVVFDNRTNTRTLTRTVTLVSEKAETYDVIVAAPGRVKVTVTPTTLEFKSPNERKSYNVEFRSFAGGNVTAGWDFGHISWKNKNHLVRSPVAFHWKN